MLRTNAVSDEIPRVAEFYNGKSVFITGAAGYIGSVLLELLLRCFPGIKSIYILLRAKKNVKPVARKEEIFNKKIFEELKNEIPESLAKVRVIPGDISLPNLGMSEDDTHLLLEEVSIVFHCAALLNLRRTLEFFLVANVLSVDTIIDLCRKMRKFEALVYTSTAYSNSNHEKFPLKEEVYRLPSHAGKFLDALKNEDEKKLQELVSLCKPDWPNGYCFSKCLAENVIADTASDLAIAIIRPSLVFSTWKHPIPGYWEENTPPAMFAIAQGKGILAVLKADPKNVLDMVPVDIVANAHVLAAWALGTKRCAFPLVIHSTSTENLHFPYGEFLENITSLVEMFPFPQSLVQHTNLKVEPNEYLFRLKAAYYHYLPAIVMDGILTISGKTPNLCSKYRFLDKVMDSSYFFTTHSFEFEKNNFEYLDKLICSEDRQNLSLDYKEATLFGMQLNLVKGFSFYDWKLDNKSQSERKKIMHKRLMQVRCIKGMFLLVCFLLLVVFIYLPLIHFCTHGRIA